jgi:predicted HTH domain antitoxin
MSQAALKYPDEVLDALQQQPAELEAEARRLLAVKMYETGRLSSGLAAKLAGIPREEFFRVLAQHQLSPLAPVEELEQDFENARRASRSE